MVTKVVVVLIDGFEMELVPAKEDEREPLLIKARVAASWLWVVNARSAHHRLYDS